MKPASFVFNLDDTAREAVAAYARDRGWDFSDLPYGYWKISAPKLTLAAYHSGKFVVQGGNAQEFVTFTLEPQILQTFSAVTADSSGGLAEIDDTPHGGIDESGKGDFFGPLVIAGVCTDKTTAPLLATAGVCDSKMIGSPARIRQIAARIREVAGSGIAVVTLRPETYNRLYTQFGNLNRLLAWGHARVIEDLLEKNPECPRMLSDKFGNESLIRRALMERGRKIVMQQHVRAESDVAVAAASILARDQFLRIMEKLSAEAGITLPRGAGPQVRTAAAGLLREHDREWLSRFVKTHFKTFNEL